MCQRIKGFTSHFLLKLITKGKASHGEAVYIKPIADKLLYSAYGQFSLNGWTMKFSFMPLLFVLLYSCQGRSSNSTEADTRNPTSTDTLKSGEFIDVKNGIIYFSLDNGNT